MHNHAERLHQLAKLLVLLALVSLGTGAAVVSGFTGALPAHKMVSRGLVVFAAAGTFLAFRSAAPAARRTSVAGFAALLLAAFTGELVANGEAVRILHSALAQIYAVTAFLLILYSAGDRVEEANPAADQGWPSLRSMSVFNAVLVGTQIALGIGIRHDLLGVLPHAITGFFVAAISLMTGMFALTQLPSHAPVREAAHGVLGLMLLQVMLGIGALLARMSENIDAWAVVLTSGHTMVGAASWGASVILAIRVFRSVRPRLAAGSEEAVAAR
ncbi:MAG: hypothetical protein K2X35_00385 [Bryobacteraceae bacterium]|nr:hypothetical protein [Bryobacteraceae bacterium]